MDDQARMKRNIILILLAIVAAVVALALISAHQNKKSPFYTKKLTDQATGETQYSLPNQGPETNVPGYITLFGSQVFFGGGATQDQFQLIQKALTAYAQKNLNNKYQTLTVLPNSFKSSGPVMSGQLQLGQSGNAVAFEIKLAQLKYVQVIITDPSGQNGGNYDSGQMVVQSSGSTMSD